MASLYYALGIYVVVHVFQSAFARCPDAWVTFGDSCYFFGHEDLTFMDAQRYCERFKANLVNIETAAENSFLESFLRDFKDTKHWIGMTDEVIEGVWKHYPSETAVYFTDWALGEPNNDRIGNCAGIWASAHYHWVDDPCTLASSKPLCEKPVQEQTRNNTHPRIY